VSKSGADPTLELRGCKIGERSRSPAGPEQRRGGGGGVQGAMVTVQSSKYSLAGRKCNQPINLTNSAKF
jgi:hypothetical protein